MTLYVGPLEEGADNETLCISPSKYAAAELEAAAGPDPDPNPDADPATGVAGNEPGLWDMSLETEVA